MGENKPYPTSRAQQLAAADQSAEERVKQLAKASTDEQEQIMKEQKKKLEAEKKAFERKKAEAKKKEEEAKK